MEIQVLDDPAPEYAKIHRQHCGSLYGWRRPNRASKTAGEWQKYLILCDGQHVKVTLNGMVVVDANLADYQDENHRRKPIPASSERKGYIGLQNHEHADRLSQHSHPHPSLTQHGRWRHVAFGFRLDACTLPARASTRAVPCEFLPVIQVGTFRRSITECGRSVAASPRPRGPFATGRRQAQSHLRPRTHWIASPAMTEPRLPRARSIDFAERQTADRRAIENAAPVAPRRRSRTRAVLGVVAYWLGPDFSEGTNRVDCLIFAKPPCC